jgi:hypothetical protein
MRVSLKCIDEKVYREDSYLAKIFKNVNFEVEVSFQLVNYKTQNYTIKNLFKIVTEEFNSFIKHKKKGNI